MWTYRLRYVRCGKARCWCATTENPPGHGPYWYGYEHRGDRVYSRYQGKRPPADFDEPARPVGAAAPPPGPDPRFVFHGKMSMPTALRILAFQDIPTLRELTKRWRILAVQHHPDVGGSNAVMAAINAAYGFLKRYAH